MEKKKIYPVLIMKYVFLIVTMLIMLYPIYMVVTNSFKTEAELYSNVLGLPAHWNLDNYTDAITDGNLVKALLNSIIIAGGSVGLVTVLGSMAAFVMTKIFGKIKSILYWIFVAGIMIPYQVGLNQLYNIVKGFGLLDTHLGLIFIFTAWCLPFTVFVMYGSFSMIPREIEEAAKLDGCSVVGLYARIVMPLSASVITATIIYNLVTVWNDMMFPMIFIDSKALKPLSTALLAFQGQFTSRYTVMFAGVVLSSLPIIVVYLLLQKKFVEGMLVGSVKG